MQPHPDEFNSIRSLLRAYPSAMEVFIHYETRCIGCAFERFCNLNDVARHYQINHEELLAAIQMVIQQPNHRSVL